MWLSTAVQIGCIYKLEVVSASVTATASSSLNSFQLLPRRPCEPVLELLTMAAKIASMPGELAVHCPSLNVRTSSIWEEFLALGFFRAIHQRMGKYGRNTHKLKTHLHESSMHAGPRVRKSKVVTIGEDSV